MRYHISYITFCILISSFGEQVLADEKDNNKGSESGLGSDKSQEKTICIIYDSQKRGDEKYLADVAGKMKGKKLYSSEIKPSGTIFECFSTTVGDAETTLKDHKDGIKGLWDYDDFLKGTGYPKMNDNDKYEREESVSGESGKQQAPMRMAKGKRDVEGTGLDPGNNNALVEYDEDFIDTFEDMDDWSDSLEGSKVKRGDEPKDIKNPNEELRSIKDYGEDAIFLSTAPSLRQSQREYIFHQNEGVDTTVYVVDSGLDMGHIAFKHKNPNEDFGWIFGGPNPATERKDYSTAISTLDDPKYYIQARGTHIVSNIIGAHTGLARRARVYMVIPYDAEQNHNPLIYLDALAKMHTQIVNLQAQANAETDPKKKQRRRVVVCFSHRVDYAVRLSEMEFWPEYSKMHENKRKFTDAITGVMDEILMDLAKMEDVVMVTRASGQTYRELNTDPILSWPARRAGSNIKNLVVVGGVNRKGQKVMQGYDSLYQQELAYAPAQDIRVPMIKDTGENDLYVQVPYSIGLAVASISGVLAGYMSKYGDTGTAAVLRLKAIAYPRISRGFSIAYTGDRKGACIPPEILKLFTKGPPQDPKDTKDLEPNKDEKPKQRLRREDPNQMIDMREYFDPGIPIPCVPFELFQTGGKDGTSSKDPGPIPTFSIRPPASATILVASYISTITETHGPDGTAQAMPSYLEEIGANPTGDSGSGDPYSPNHFGGGSGDPQYTGVPDPLTENYPEYTATGEDPEFTDTGVPDDAVTGIEEDPFPVETGTQDLEEPPLETVDPTPVIEETPSQSESGPQESATLYDPVRDDIPFRDTQRNQEDEQALDEVLANLDAPETSATPYDPIQDDIPFRDTQRNPEDEQALEKVLANLDAPEKSGPAPRMHPTFASVSPATVVTSTPTKTENRVTQASTYEGITKTDATLKTSHVSTFKETTATIGRKTSQETATNEERDRSTVISQEVSEPGTTFKTSTKPGSLSSPRSVI